MSSEPRILTSDSKGLQAESAETPHLCTHQSPSLVESGPVESGLVRKSVQFSCARSLYSSRCGTWPVNYHSVFALCDVDE